VYYKPDVSAIASVTVFGQADMPEHGVGSSLGDLVYCDPEIFQSPDGTHTHAVVHRHDDGIARVPTKNTLKPN
jgi:hypothetical protein